MKNDLRIFVICTCIALLFIFFQSMPARAQNTIEFIVTQRYLKDEDPVPMPQLGLDVEDITPTIDNMKVICSGQTDERGHAICYLKNCDQGLPIPITMNIAFKENIMFSGPWKQPLTIKRCRFYPKGPVPVEFKDRQIVTIESALLRISALDNKLGSSIRWTELTKAQISSTIYADALEGQTKSLSRDDPIWSTIDTTTIEAAKIFKELAGAYNEIALSAPEGPIKSKASRLAAQYSAYAVTGMNFGVYRIGTVAGKDDIKFDMRDWLKISSSVSDLNANARFVSEHLTLADPSKIAISQGKISAVVNGLKSVAGAERIQNKEFNDWADAYSAAIAAPAP